MGNVTGIPEHLYHQVHLKTQWPSQYMAGVAVSERRNFRPDARHFHAGRANQSQDSADDLFDAVMVYLKALMLFRVIG